MSRIVRERERLHRELEDLRKRKPPGPYENAKSYGTMMMIVQQIDDAAEDNVELRTFLPHQRIIYGTLPVAEVNAACIPLAFSHDYLVVFYSGFFPFADLMTQSVAQAVPISEPSRRGVLEFSMNENDVRENLANHPDIQSRFSQILIDHLLVARPDTVPPSYLMGTDFTHETISTMLMSGMGLFALGHEYGHIVNEPSAPTTISTLGGQTVKLLKYNWQQELDADAYGAKLAFLVLEKKPRNLATILIATDFYFKCNEITERGASLIRTGKENQVELTDHPPAQKRREHLRLELKKFLRTYRKGIYSDQAWKEAEREADQFDNIMDILYEGTRPNLVILHRQGEKLARNWQ